MIPKQQWYHWTRDMLGKTRVTPDHDLCDCGYFKGQEQTVFNPTSWHLVTYNFL